MPEANEQQNTNQDSSGNGHDDNKPQPQLSPEQKARKKARSIFIGGLIVLILATAGVLWYLHSRTYEETDDAQVDGHIAPISARIAGTVTAVYVQNDDRVQAGKPLIDLDQRPQEVTLQQNRAEFEQALAQLHAQQPNVPITRNNNRADVDTDQAQLDQSLAAVAGAEHDRDQQKAKLADAIASNARDQAEYQRYKYLYDRKEASREDLDKYAATAVSSQANVDASQAAVASGDKTIDQRKAQAAAQRTKVDQDRANAPQQLAMRQANIASERANAESAKAAIDQANLNLSFTKIAAPVNGVVTQRSAEIGSHVAEGAQLLMLVETDDLWVTANFKETQLQRMQLHQSVRIHVDALNRNFDGYVDSMPAVTGARSSVLPPENATGNYVKVVQRLPIRIRFKAGQDGLDRLRPGMSVEPRVYLR